MSRYGSRCGGAACSGPRSSAWNDGAKQFGVVIERLLDAAPRPCLHRIEVRRRVASRKVGLSTKTVLLPVRVINWGHAGRPPRKGRAAPSFAIGSWMPGGQEATTSAETPLPGLLMPGHSLAAGRGGWRAVVAGATYEVVFWAEQVGTAQAEPPLTTSLRLIVEERSDAAVMGCCGPLLEMVQAVPGGSGPAATPAGRLRGTLRKACWRR